jgi:hypothetical protein
MSLKLPSTVCALPWTSIEAGPDGAARPCCLAAHDITNSDGTKYDLNVTTLEAAYHSEYMQNLRKQFRDGVKPETCKRCWDEEAAGRASKRVFSKNKLRDVYNQIDWVNDKPDQLWFLDLKLGNICNLKCRICSSYASSKWVEEELSYMGPNVKKEDTTTYSYFLKGQWPRKTTTFWENLKKLLPNVKYFEFTGGEPWLIKEHVELLQFAVENGYSKNIEVHYNTNATQPPDKLAELWTNFKFVDIAFSIDNVTKRYEYERYGANWEIVNKNIDTVHALRDRQSNMTTQLCFTINIQNVYYIDELLAWAETKNFSNIYFNMLHVPSYMSIQCMTIEAQKLVIDKLSNTGWKPEYRKDVNNVIHFIENGKGSDGVEFRRRMKQMDIYRKQNFNDTHTEIAQAMGYNFIQS